MLRGLRKNEPVPGGVFCRALAAQLNPLKALQTASGTHWRAAAWLLERTCPERFARPDLKRLDAADIQEIFVSLLEEINDAIPDRALCLRVYQRLSGCFQAKVQEVWAAKSARRDPRRVRQLLERFEHTNRRRRFPTTGRKLQATGQCRSRTAIKTMSKLRHRGLKFKPFCPLAPAQEARKFPVRQAPDRSAGQQTIGQKP